MQTRYKIFQKRTFFWTVLYHMLSNCSFWILKIYTIMGGSETLAWNPEYVFGTVMWEWDSGFAAPFPRWSRWRRGGKGNISSSGRHANTAPPPACRWV